MSFLTYEPALRRSADELGEVARFRIQRQLRLDAFERLVQRQVRSSEKLVGFLERLDGLVREAFPLKSDGVDAVGLRGAVADGLDVRKHVLRRDGEAAHERVLADTAELMNRRERADVG